MAEKRSKEIGFLAKSYLLLYNIVQALGWSYIFVISCQHFLSQNAVTSKGLYVKVEVALKLFQTAAIFEIIHCAIGIVPSSPVTTAMQVFSRLCTVWLFTVPDKQVQNNPSILMYLTAWTITEIVRYSFYACSLVNRLPYFLQWCRYTFFIILYPIGMTGEILTVLAAMPYVKKTGIYSLSLPNRLNISFSLLYFLYFVLVMYLPAFLMLYTYMFRQRKKVLGKTSNTLTKQD